MTKLNVYGSGYTKTSLNINQNLNIKNYLRVYEVLGVNNIQINNFGYIEKDLNLYKDIDITEKFKYPIIDIQKKDKNSLIVKNDLNCYYYTTFNKLSSIGDIIIKLDDNYQSNIKINSDINVFNKVISDIDLLKDEISTKNSTFTQNIIVDNETVMFDCDVFRINCNNYTTQNLDILNNTNCNKFYNIKINNNLNINKNVNLFGNTNIKESLTVNGTMKFSANSIFVLPKKSNNQNYGILQKGSLRYNDERKSIEYYTDTWNSISSLHSSDYITFIKIHENTNSNDTNNIEFYRNNILGIELNNNTYNLNIYKKHSNFNSNLNVDGLIKVFPNNIYVNNFITNKNTFIDKLLVLGNFNTNNTNNTNNTEDGSLRFNENSNTLQLYNNGFGKLNFYSNYSGIDVTENNNINIFFNNNQILCNNNLITFSKNININSNLNVSGSITSKNTYLSNEIIFNNKAILQFKNSLLNAYVAPNYNTTSIEHYKTLNVNMPDSVVTDLDIYYTSNILYSLVNYTNYNYVLNTFVYDDLIHNNIFKFIYISTTNTNILINRFEINSFINHSEINNTEILNLNEIKSKYNILVYQKNKLIYSSENNNTSFILEKNSYYTIQIKLKSNFSTNKNNVLLFIRLLGFYYVDCIYNDNIDFIYKIDNKFKNDVEFLQNLNILQNFNIEESLISNNYYHHNLFINNTNISNISNNTNNTNIFISNNSNLVNINNIFVIQNNNIGIGTSITNNNSNISIKTKDNFDTFNIIGKCIIKNNLNIKNNITITNNATINILNYNKLNTDSISCNLNTKIVQNINCKNINTQNIISNHNLLNKTHTNSLVFNNEIYSLDKLINKNINISDNIINFKNTLRINNLCNISINSHELYDAFTIGNKIKPNLSISHNGYTVLNTTNEGFILDNINLFDKFKNLKYIV